jgi:hypothetical protein
MKTWEKSEWFEKWLEMARNENQQPPPEKKLEQLFRTEPEHN